MKNIMIKILKFIQKSVFFLFLFIALVSLTDKELWIWAFITFIIFAIIVYPTFYKMFIKNDWKISKNTFKLKSFFNNIKSKVSKNPISNLEKEEQVKYYNIVSWIEEWHISLDSKLSESIKDFSEKNNIVYFDLISQIFKSIWLTFVTDDTLKNRNEIIINFIDLFITNDEEKSKIKNYVKEFLIDYYIHIIEDYKITDEEKLLIEKLCNKFDITLEEIWFNQDEFNRYYTIYLIEDKNELPEPKVNWDLPIVLKKWEKIHWLEPAFIYKTKTETVRSNYYVWWSTSIRIAKWVRFSVWSYKRPSYKRDVTYLEDKWYFIISNQRVWFIGAEQNFWINYNKIVNIQANEEWLVIMKENTKKPYKLTLENYNIWLLLISKIINDI